MPRMSLELVVVAIVILVVALVVLTIFGVGITPMGTLTDFRNNCKSTGTLSCQSTGAEPFNWRNDVNIGGAATSCMKEIGVFSDCCVRSGTTHTWICP